MAIDVNGTRFHSLDGARDWQQALSDGKAVGVEWNNEQQEVALTRGFLRNRLSSRA